MTLPIAATIGATALYLLVGWLLSCIVGQYLADRKGYGERAGLATGMLVPVVGALVWLLVPARQNSKWKLIGPVGRSARTRRA
jgi:hypothetical protein